MVSGAVPDLRLTVLVSRWLQPAGAGAFFELIALFTIAFNTSGARSQYRADALDLAGPRRRRPGPGAPGRAGRAAASRGRRRRRRRSHLGGGAGSGPGLPARPASRRWRGRYQDRRTAGAAGRAVLCLTDGARGFGAHGRSWRSRVWASQQRASPWSSARSWPGWACTAPSSPGAYRSPSAWWPLGHLRRHPQIRGPSDGGHRPRGVARPHLTALDDGAWRRQGKHRGPAAPATERRQRPGVEFWRFTGPRALARAPFR